MFCTQELKQWLSKSFRLGENPTYLGVTPRHPKGSKRALQ
jgi:hypothetical protein